MHRKSEKGVLLVMSMMVVFIAGAVVTTLMVVSTAGTTREMGRDFHGKSREIAEASLDLSLNSLRQATDGVDNDGDGTADEGIDQVEEPACKPSRDSLYHPLPTR